MLSTQDFLGGKENQQHITGANGTFVLSPVQGSTTAAHFSELGLLQPDIIEQLLYAYQTPTVSTCPIVTVHNSAPMSNSQTSTVRQESLLAKQTFSAQQQYPVLNGHVPKIQLQDVSYTGVKPKSHPAMGNSMSRITGNNQSKINSSTVGTNHILKNNHMGNSHVRTNQINSSVTRQKVGSYNGLSDTVQYSVKPDKSRNIKSKQTVLPNALSSLNNDKLYNKYNQKQAEQEILSKLNSRSNLDNRIRSQTASAQSASAPRYSTSAPKNSTAGQSYGKNLPTNYSDLLSLAEKNVVRSQPKPLSHNVQSKSTSSQSANYSTKKSTLNTSSFYSQKNSYTDSTVRTQSNKLSKSRRSSSSSNRETDTPSPTNERSDSRSPPLIKNSMQSPPLSRDLISAAYTEPLGEDSVYCGNVVKARYTDGKLYRGEIIKVDNTRQRCLVEFMQHPECWCSMKDIFPSSPVKSQIIKRLLAAKAKARCESPLATEEEDEVRHSSPRDQSPASRDDDKSRARRSLDETMTLSLQVEESESDHSVSREESLSSDTGYGPSGDRDDTTQTSDVDDVITVTSSESVKDDREEEEMETEINEEEDEGSNESEVDEDMESDDEAGDKSTADVFCEKCHCGDSEEPNEIVICDKCSKGYHQRCHKPIIPSSVVENEEAEWFCQDCNPNSRKFRKSRVGHDEPKKIVEKLPRKETKESRKVEKKKLEEPITYRPSLPWGWALPSDINDLDYQPENLDWDEGHLTNKQGQYCYCGENGLWFLQMIQCHSCLQWYHQECVQCLKSPLMFGDRFFAYVCSLCNAGQEFVLRLHLRWVDFLHLALFNLGLLLGKKVLDVVDDVMPFIDENSHWLQLPKDIEEYNPGQLQDKVLSVLKEECKTGRFRNSKKDGQTYSLCVRCPPHPPIINLPPTRPLTRATTSKWPWKHSYRKFIQAQQYDIGWKSSQPMQFHRLPKLPKKSSSPVKTKAAEIKKKYKKAQKSPKKPLPQSPPKKVGLKRKRDESPDVKPDAKPPPRKKHKKLKKRVARFNRCEKKVRCTSYAPTRLLAPYNPNMSPTYRPIIEKQPPKPLLTSSPVKRELNFSNTLEKLIPRQQTYSGLHHPFLLDVEKREIKDRAIFKQTAVKVCTKQEVILDLNGLVPGGGVEPSTSDLENSQEDKKGKHLKNAKKERASKLCAKNTIKAAIKDSGDEIETDIESKCKMLLESKRAAFKYDPYIVIAKRREEGQTHYALAWDPINI